MILGKSTDKVKIKKIPIRAWSLTDEIDATVANIVNEHPDIEAEKIQLIKTFYESLPSTEWNKKVGLTLIPGGKNEETKVAPAPTDNAAAPVTSPTAEINPNDAAQTVATATQTPAEATTVEAGTANIATEKIAETKNKEITNLDFLKLRKDNFRSYPSEDKISHGFSILYDITIDRILFFSAKPFKPGQQITVDFCVPKSFTVVADVLSVVNTGFGSRIISQHFAPYRIVATFALKHLGDRTLLRNFLASIDQREIVVNK